MEVNRYWREIAEGLDRERAEGNVRGPLHGTRVIVKDDMGTDDRINMTDGNLALLRSKVVKDALEVRKLRKACVI
ncbi:hypothetical protein MBLNU230_g0580t1 [Neophaeotheca triangularis]